MTGEWQPEDDFEDDMNISPDAITEIADAISYHDTAHDTALAVPNMEAITKEPGQAGYTELASGRKLSLGQQKLGDHIITVDYYAPHITPEHQVADADFKLARWARHMPSLVAAFLSENPFGWKANKNITARFKGFYTGGTLEVVVISFQLDGGEEMEYTFKTTSQMDPDSPVTGLYVNTLERQNWVSQILNRHTTNEKLRERFAEVLPDWEVKFLEDVAFIGISNEKLRLSALVSKRVEGMEPAVKVFREVQFPDRIEYYKVVARIIQILAEEEELMGTDYNAENFQLYFGYPGIPVGGGKKKILLLDTDLVFRNIDEHPDEVKLMSMQGIPLVHNDRKLQKSTQQIMNMNLAYLTISALVYSLRVNTGKLPDVTQAVLTAYSRAAVSGEDTVKLIDLDNSAGVMAAYCIGIDVHNRRDEIPDYMSVKFPHVKELLKNMFRDMVYTNVGVAEFAERVDANLAYVVELHDYIQQIRNELGHGTES